MKNNGRVQRWLGFRILTAYTYILKYGARSANGTTDFPSPYRPTPRNVASVEDELADFSYFLVALRESIIVPLVYAWVVSSRQSPVCRGWASPIDVRVSSISINTVHSFNHQAFRLQRAFGSLFLGRPQYLELHHLRKIIACPPL